MANGALQIKRIDKQSSHNCYTANELTLFSTLACLKDVISSEKRVRALFEHVSVAQALGTVGYFISTHVRLLRRQWNLRMTEPLIKIYRGQELSQTYHKKFCVPPAHAAYRQHNNICWKRIATFYFVDFLHTFLFERQ